MSDMVKYLKDCVERNLAGLPQQGVLCIRRLAGLGSHLTCVGFSERYTIPLWCSVDYLFSRYGHHLTILCFKSRSLEVPTSFILMYNIIKEKEPKLIVLLTMQFMVKIISNVQEF